MHEFQPFDAEEYKRRFWNEAAYGNPDGPPAENPALLRTEPAPPFSLKGYLRSLLPRKSGSDRSLTPIIIGKTVVTLGVLYTAIENNIPYLDPTKMSPVQNMAGFLAMASSFIQTIFPENQNDGSIKKNIKLLLRQPLISYYALAYSLPLASELSKNLLEPFKYISQLIQAGNISSPDGAVEILGGGLSAAGLIAIAGMYLFTFIPTFTQIRDSLSAGRHRKSLNIYSSNVKPSTLEATLAYAIRPSLPPLIDRFIVSPGRIESERRRKASQEETGRKVQAELNFHGQDILSFYINCGCDTTANFQFKMKDIIIDKTQIMMWLDEAIKIGKETNNKNKREGSNLHYDLNPLIRYRNYIAKRY